MMKKFYSRTGAVRRVLTRPVCLSLLGLSLAAWTAPGQAQVNLHQKVSVQLKQQTLRQTLRQLSAAAHVPIAYANTLPLDKKVSVAATDEELDAVLRRVLQPLQLRYRIVAERIIVEPVTPQTTSASRATPVQGTVLDAQTGEGLPGVNIVVKGTTTGTTTDAQGRYQLTVPEDAATLVYSFIGYLTQEVPLSAQTNFTIRLAPDNKALDEVVVVGYGTQKKVNLTGAVSTVSAKELENRPVQNVALALQGLAPGLAVTRATGQPGDEGIGLQIRGATSANGSVDPLLIVDGVTTPGLALQTLNPNDIETISVLKDAAAAALYGAQAAGGVILVTTKKGKPGKTVFDYSSIVGLDWALNVPERMPVWEELAYNNLARINAGAAPAQTEETLQILREGRIPYTINPTDSTRYRYYGTESIVDQLIRKNSLMQTHNVSARGGAERLNFLLSAGYYGKQGMFKVGPDRNDRYNFRLNLGSQLTRHLSLDSRLSYTRQRQEASSTDVNGTGALLYNLYRYSSINPLLTPEGRYNASTGATAYALMDAGGYNNFNRNLFDGVFTARLSEVAKGLELRAVYGAQYWRGDREIFKRTVERWYRTVPGGLLNTPNSYSLGRELTQNNNLQFLADYDRTLGEKHHFHLLGGYQWEDSRAEAVTTGVTSLVNNEVPALGLGDETTKTSTQTVATYAFQSYFGRLNYNYDNKYLLEATFRVDESSRLAPNARRKLFPSVSAGWNLHREAWFPLPVVSELKLRGSWGRLGAASGIGLYDYLGLLTRGSNLVLGSPETKTTYFAQTVVPSSQLSWETIETSNAGLDLGFFQNKLHASFDYYVKYNRNMLTALQLPATFGVGTPRINNGELKSWGWETELGYRNQAGRNLTYSVSLNVADNQNKLLDFAGRRVIGPGTVGTLEGYPLNSIWGYRTAGYFQTADEVTNAPFQDSRTGPGDVRYVDVNGDGRITSGSGSAEDHGDLVYLGTTQPRYLFGTTLAAQWKGFDVTVFLQGVGKRAFLPTRQALDPSIASYYQALAIHRDYWTPENPDAQFPRPYTNATHNFLTADKWVLNGRYVRLKNLQVGYTLPGTLVNKVKLSRARVYFTGQDLLTFSGLGVFQGYFDPEQRNGVSADYPFFGTAALGLNLTF